MADPISDLQAAGFDQNEIGAWAVNTRQALAAADFPDNEIDAYFAGGPVVPDKIPDALVRRVADKSLISDIGDFAHHGVETILKNEPDKDVGDAVEAFALKNGMTPEQAKRQRETIEGRMQRGNVLFLTGPIEVLSSPFLGAYRNFVSRPTEEKTGVPKEITEGLSMLGLAFFGLGRSMLRKPSGEPISRLPESKDIVDAADALAGGKAPTTLQNTLNTLYEKLGILPSEAVHDALGNPAVKKNFLAGALDELLARYGAWKRPAAEAAEEPKPVAKGEEGSAPSAIGKVADETGKIERSPIADETNSPSAASKAVDAADEIKQSAKTEDATAPSSVEKVVDAADDATQATKAENVELISPPPSEEFTYENLKAAPADGPRYFQTRDSKRFLIGPSGSHDLTVIPDLPTGQASAPVRLTRRWLYHIDDFFHRTHAQRYGYRDNFHVLFDVMDNWSEVRTSQTHANRVVLVRPLKSADAVVVVELSKADNAPFWHVHSTGLRSKQQLGDVIYTRVLASGNNAGQQQVPFDPASSPEGVAGDPSPITQTGKDNANSILEPRKSKTGPDSSGGQRSR